MNTKSSAYVVVFLAIAFAGSRSDGQTGWSIDGNYGYNVYVRDDYQSLSNLPTTDSKGGGQLLGPGTSVAFVFAPGDWEAKLGGDDGQDSIAQASVVGQVGSFHLFTQAIADTHRTQNFLPLNQVYAQSSAGATLNFKDQLTFRSKKPGTQLVTAHWTITSDSSTGSAALGVVSPSGGPAGNYDYVVSQAESYFQLSGTGVPHAPPFTPASGGVGNDSTWAYSYKIDGGVVQPTIDKIQFQSPTSILVSFLATPGQKLSVGWTFTAYASARSNNFDLNDGIGIASSNSVYNHTINWGGITSVVDVDSGQPNLDWSVESASGLDYANPVGVPEPASILLFATAIFAAWPVRRRPYRPR